MEWFVGDHSLVRSALSKTGGVGRQCLIHLRVITRNDSNWFHSRLLNLNLGRRHVRGSVGVDGQDTTPA